MKNIKYMKLQVAVRPEGADMSRGFDLFIDDYRSMEELIAHCKKVSGTEGEFLFYAPAGTLRKCVSMGKIDEDFFKISGLSDEEKSMVAIHYFFSRDMDDAIRDHKLMKIVYGSELDDMGKGLIEGIVPDGIKQYVRHVDLAADKLYAEGYESYGRLFVKIPDKEESC